jgi:hypothetical protein
MEAVEPGAPKADLFAVRFLLLRCAEEAHHRRCSNSKICATRADARALLARCCSI